MYTLSAQRLREFARLAVRYRWDGRAVLATAGIAPASVDRPCSGITMDKAAAVLRRLWVLTGDKFLGLGPHPVCRNTLRILALATSGAPTLGDGLARVEQFTPLLAGMPVLTSSSADGRTTLALDLDGFDQQVPLIADSALVIVHRVMNWATRSRIQLLQVDVPYERPGDQPDHDFLFGAPVRFGAARTALTLQTCALDAPLVRRQDEVEGFLSDVPTVLLSEFDFSTTHTQRVRGIIERCSGDHLCTADEIAAKMGLSRQTLRRRLSEENTSVSAIRDDVLRTAALASLAQGGETMAALACRLGFSEPSAFTRAFRRWTGHSPTAFLYRHRTTDEHDRTICRHSSHRSGERKDLAG